MSRFRVRLEHRGHSLVATGSVLPWRPASLYGHPDAWRPADGGEIEDLRVALVRGGRECWLCPEMVRSLDLDGKIWEELNGQ